MGGDRAQEEEKEAMAANINCDILIILGFFVVEERLEEENSQKNQ